MEDYYVNDDYLDRLQQVIDWSISKGLVTVLDFHGAKLKEQFLYTFSNSSMVVLILHTQLRLNKADINKFKAIWKGFRNDLKIILSFYYLKFLMNLTFIFLLWILIP